MATAVKQRRGTATEHDSDKGDGSGFTGLEGEITVDTTNDTIRVHDGSQVGGHRLAKYSELSTVATAITTTDESSDTTCFPLLSTDATGNLAAKTDASSLTYNASTGQLESTIVSSGTFTFTGLPTGDVGQITTSVSSDNVKMQFKLGDPSEGYASGDRFEFIGTASDLGGETVLMSVHPSGDPATVTVDGTLSATTLTGSLNANQLTGTIADARIPSTIARDSELSSFITASSTDTLTNKSISGQQINSGTIPFAQLPTITSVGTLAQSTLSITDTTTGSTTENPSLELYRNGGAGADGHELGAIKFFGNNDAGSPEKIEYAKIYAELIDATDGTEDGSLKFHLMSNGSSEDPVMTLQQFGLIMASGNSIYLGANGTLSFEGTDETNNLETAIVATNPTADRTITLPDATGTVVLNSSGVISESVTLMELSSTDAGAGELPVISLYRNSASPANNDEMGSIRFFGNNGAGTPEKVFYAGIYCEAPKVDASGAHKASLRINLADGSGGTTGITDPTADVAGDKDPVVIITTSNFELKECDLFVHDGQNIVIDGSSNKTTLTHVEPTADRTVSLPDATGTLAHIASNGGLQHPALSSNPSSPANGQTYYNTTDHKLKLYANGAWVDLN